MGYRRQTNQEIFSAHSIVFGTPFAPSGPIRLAQRWLAVVDLVLLLMMVTMVIVFYLILKIIIVTRPVIAMVS